MAVHAHEDKRPSAVLVVLGVVAAFVIGFGAGYFTGSPPGLSDVGDSSEELAKAAIDSDLLPVKGSPAKGSNAAPVTIVEFGDFQCTACASTSEAIVDRAFREYGAENVRVIWKHLPLSNHPDARIAAQASWAAAQQGKFWEYHDVVFSNFPKRSNNNDGDWTASWNSFLKADKLVEYAASLSLDTNQFQRDMNSPAAQAAVNADEALARNLGLRSTPSIYVNGRQVNFRQGVSYDAVKQVIDDERGKATSIMEAPNAYYSYAVFANSSLPDGIKTAAPVAQAVAAAPALEGAAEAAPTRAGAAAAPSAALEKAAAAPAAAGSATGPDIATLPQKGAKNAKVTIVEFSDFQCPFCGKVNPTIDAVLKAYPNDVRVAFAQFPLDFHKDAHLAGQATIAAHEQGKFWEYHDVLFENQKALKRADLEKYAEQLGLNMAKFKSALDSGKYKAMVDQHLADGRKFGLTGTPSFLINGVKFVGAQPVDAFKKAIDKEIARADQVAKAKRLTGDALYKELVRTAPREAPKPAAPAKPADDGSRHFVNTGSNPILGNPNAPVTIMEFSDFECPFCSKAGKTIKEIAKANPDTVKVVFKHFPLDFHKNAPLAHRASIAAQNQGKFWEYHDILFENVKALKRPDLEKYAEQLGLNMEKFKKDLDNAELDKIVSANKAEGAKVSVRGTPHFFINGTRLSGAQPQQAFQDAVDRELKIAQKYLKQGTKAADLYKTIVDKEKPQAPPKAEIDLKGSPFKGAANGKVVIVEFSDFECPFCSKVNPTIDTLLKDYPNDVKVVFKQLPLNFHANAHLAGQASLAAHAQGKFWEYHDILFQNQKALKRPELEKYAEQLGLNMAKFKAALDNGTYKKAVDDDLAQARGVGITGTPSFLINGEKFVGAQPVDKFKEKIDAILAK